MGCTCVVGVCQEQENKGTLGELKRSLTALNLTLADF